MENQRALDPMTSDDPVPSLSITEDSDLAGNVQVAPFQLVVSHSDFCRLDRSVQSECIPSSGTVAYRNSPARLRPLRRVPLRRRGANASPIPAASVQIDNPGAVSNVRSDISSLEDAELTQMCPDDGTGNVEFAASHSERPSRFYCDMSLADYTIATAADNSASVVETTVVRRPVASTASQSTYVTDSSSVTSSIGHWSVPRVIDVDNRNETISSSYQQSSLQSYSICSDKSSGLPSDSERNDTSDNSSPDCPICLLPSTYPVRLPCSHVFCFLCAKGCGSRCALCRAVVPGHFWRRPHLLDSTVAILASSSRSGCHGCVDSADDADRFSWFYEGGGGWWQYDVNACKQLEEALTTGCEECRLLLAGHVYSVDLRQMTQQRVGTIGSRCRRVKRDLKTAAKKGVAGLYLPTN